MKKNVVCITNLKGGVGKTTSVFNIASAATKPKIEIKNRKERIIKPEKTVLMVDLDPQASLTLSAGYDPRSFDVSIRDLLVDTKTTLSDVVYTVDDIPGLSLIPSGRRLALVELDLLREPDNVFRLKKAIDQARDFFDYIFIDCPPQLSILTLNAFVASDYAVVACETGRLSFYALEELQDTLKEINETVNIKIDIIGLVATMFSSREKSDKQVLEELKKGQVYNFLGYIKRGAAAKRGLDKGLPAIVNQPYEELSVQYRSVTQKILSYIDKGENNHG